MTELNGYKKIKTGNKPFRYVYATNGRAFVVNVILEKLTKFKSYKRRFSVIIYKCLFSSVGRAFVVNVIPEKLTKFLTYKHRA